MRIIFHVGGMPFNGSTISDGKSLGGSESAGYYMAREMARLGHEVVIFTSSPDTGFSDGVFFEWMGERSEQYPLGHRFDVSSKVPADVTIIQRIPFAFRKPINSKLNIWWVHDIGLMRHSMIVQQQLVNIDQIFTVSEFHKNQFAKVFDIPKHIITATFNGVDYTYPEELEAQNLPRVPKSLVFASRPERGLENLVGRNGIMKSLPDCHLYVCGYDNTVPQMRDYYRYLYNRCDQLDNVTNLGSLGKNELYKLLAKSELCVYPTTFEDTSNMMLLESNAVGTPFIGPKDRAALPQTGHNAGVKFVPLKDGKIHKQAFVKCIKECLEASTWDRLHIKALGKEQTWKAAAMQWDQVFNDLLYYKCNDKRRLYKHLEHHSDIIAIGEDHPAPDMQLLESVLPGFRKNYEFLYNNDFKGHYDRYYEYEESRGVKYGPEDLTGQPRFEHTARLIDEMGPGAILDYGCAHGHYVMNLMNRYPHIRFFGADINAKNIEIARRWALDVIGDKSEQDQALDTVNNLFFQSTADDDFDLACNVDVILLQEILEHVPNPGTLVEQLSTHLAPEGHFLISVPYGPWEALGYKKHPGWRAHIHHIEREDLYELFRAQEDFKLIALPHRDNMGHYIVTFKYNPDIPIGKIDYVRKLKQQAPRETLSVCMIAKNEQHTIGRTIESIIDIADEIIIGLDETTTDETYAVAMQFVGPENIIPIKSPMETGFAVARQVTIDAASMDWILWIDCDETFEQAENLPKYLRNNCMDGYGIKQHHYAVEPAELFKTDYPCRLFRNNKGMKFFGFVHEHPEKEMNKGPGKTHLIDDVAIMHTGYPTEQVRRKRFERNFPLIQKDRELNPDRNLGKFLWVRDLAHFARYSMEQNGGVVTPRIEDAAAQGIEMWRELLKTGDLRLITQSIPFYSECVYRLMNGNGIDFTLAITSGKGGNRFVLPDRKIEGLFASIEDIKKLNKVIVDKSVEHYENKYY